MNSENIPELAPNEVASRLAESAGSLHIVDVRRPDEFTGELGRVPGSVLKTMETDLNGYLQSIPESRRSEPIIFVCRSGARSGRVTAYALQLGFTNAYNMTGGMIYWNELGLKTEK